MISRLYQGRITHERFSPVSHRLEYRLYTYALDLGELDQLDRQLPLFGYNRLRPAALYDADYLDTAVGSIRQKLLARLPEKIAGHCRRIILVTSLRYMGHVFNPVSFYYCFDAKEQLLATVAEVNNTFGEKHIYVLNGGAYSEAKRTYPVHFEAEKAFHVSPFNNMEGRYRFSFADIRDTLDIRIDLHRNGKHVLKAHLTGSAQMLNRQNHLKTLLLHPAIPHLTLPRIYWQAAKLKFAKKLTYHPKPIPQSPMTIRSPAPTIWQKRCMAMLLNHLDRVSRGHLEVTLPDRRRVAFGRVGAAPAAQIKINDYGFFTRVMLGADIGFGEAYMDGQWETDNVIEVIRFFIRNRDTLDDGRFQTAWLKSAVEWLRYLLQRNSLPGSRKNIQRHYDLSNAFFSTFLDRSMAYSCGIYKNSDDSLHQAQINKFDAIIAKARLTANDHLLDIGCGWAGFAIHAVRQTGCRVTGITISEEQYRHARRKVRKEGLEDRIQIIFSDYRKITGRFDKIVSIEMLEAVGHAYFGSFFERLDHLLKPDGMAVLQVITIPDQYFPRYRKERDWIQKHIFPGGQLPSLNALLQAMTRHSRLTVESSENIAHHYAPTLAHWRQRFDANHNQVAALGFDAVFQRKWRYYLASCEAGFRERVLGNLQMVVTRAGNRRLNTDQPI